MQVLDDMYWTLKMINRKVASRVSQTMVYMFYNWYHIFQGELYIAKKVLGKFVKIPCVDNFGSCSYDDLCQLLEQVQCPGPIVKIGIDCKCPLKAVRFLVMVYFGNHWNFV